MNRRIFIRALIFVAFFTIFNAKTSQAIGPTMIWRTIDTPTTWTKENSPYIVSGSVSVRAPLTIEPGVVVKFNSNAALAFFSTLQAIGNEDEHIIFTSIKDDFFGGDTNGDGSYTKPAPGDWSSINFYVGSSGDVEYASVLYGSTLNTVKGSVTIAYTDDVVLKNSEIRYAGYAGLYIGSAQPKSIENNLISDNLIGILSWSKITPKITNNSIVNNHTGALTNSSTLLDARNNWWGDKSGPYNLVKNPSGKGDSVNNYVIFDSWLNKDPVRVRKPVVLIPGIGASINPDLMIGGVFNDNWTMFDHTYDGIIQAFKNMGYVENQDFFIAYYDWRKSNADSANNYLKKVIETAKTSASTSKVNLVAHSMGGLVARSYIQGNDYANDVDNLIMIATPNKGSSDVYDAWEGGHIPNNWDNKYLMKVYLEYITDIKKDTSSYYQTIHRYISSVKELMPLYKYIHPKTDSQNLKNYAEMSEVNDFLINLNNKIDLLNQRVKVSIIAGKEQPTVNNIPVVNSDDSDPDLWKDGKPDPIDPEKNDANGDGEVLLSSAQIQSTFNDPPLPYSHGDIVSEAETLVAQRLSETLENTIRSPQINDELGFWFASPVDVEIKAPDNKIITSANINQIDLAKYASESKPDGFKIFSIPNPQKGDYEVKIIGNGDGEYHIGSEYFDYTGNRSDHSSLVQGEIKLGEVKEYKISYNPDDHENPINDIKPKDSTPPVITINSPENGKDYLNNANLDFIYNAVDNESGVKNTIAHLDGKEFVDKKIDLSLFRLGKHSLEVSSEDNAANQDTKVSEFSIMTNVDAIKDNINHYRNLDLITDQKTADFLQVKLRDISHTLDMIAKMGGKDNTNPAENKTELSNKQIGDLVEFIQDKLSQTIIPPAKDLLIESLNNINI